MVSPDHNWTRSGTMRGAEHLLPVRVYYEDTDAAGMVYYANYLKFMERGRTDLLRLSGIIQSEMMALGGVGFVVRRCHIDFLGSARLDDLLEVVTRVDRVGGAVVDLKQTVRGGGDDLVRAEVRIACLNKAGKPTRLPADIRAALDAITTPQS